jgi:hypothetical protein
MSRESKWKSERKMRMIDRGREKGREKEHIEREREI